MRVLVLRKSAFSNACQYQLYPASRVASIAATLLARYSSWLATLTRHFERQLLKRTAPLLTLKQSGNNFC